MDNNKNYWIDKLIRDKFSIEILLNKVVRTVIKDNSIKSVLSWSNLYIDINDCCIKHDNIFPLDTILDLFSKNYGKYDLIIIESHKLI